MRLFRKSSLVLLLEKRNVLSHDFDAFMESFLGIYHFHATNRIKLKPCR